MVIDHIGIAVRSIETALPRWRDAFGYEQATAIVTNTRQQVNVVFLAHEGSIDVKLIEPTATTSPVEAFVRRGGGLHHLCFRVASVDRELARLVAMGMRSVTEPEPGEAFEDHPIAFVYAGEGLNVELIDTTRRAGRLASTLGEHATAEDGP